MDLIPDLPVLIIKSSKDVPFTEVEFEMDDKTFKLFSDIGKREASDEDYINIAIRNMLNDHFESIKDKEKSDEDNNN